MEKSYAIGTCLLAAAFLSYTGSFTSEYREKIIYNDWLQDIRAKGIPTLDVFNISEVLSTLAERTQCVIYKAYS